jgi:hypothetical protein
MAIANLRIRNNPALQRMPQDSSQWRYFMNELSNWVLKITPTGTITGQDQLNTITAFNRGSSQSAAPITAADVGSDVTATIAAHNLIYDSTTLAYNSGTITGLSFSTTYYIYVDDPTKAGGAVTYVATTTATDITNNIGRYYVGEITTPADGAGDTTGGGGGGAGAGPGNGNQWP